MIGATLQAAMTYPGYPAPLSPARYAALAPRVTVALAQAGCTTTARAAMFLAQIGAESGSLRWTEELASGAAYEGNHELGNSHSGDGVRFKGRSYLQITGRAHYTNLSRWAAEKGYVPGPNYFVEHPTMLAFDQYAFLGPVWYWTVARPGLNALADSHDILAATMAVNGGDHALAERTARWKTCLTLGTALLPPKDFTMDAATTAQIQKMLDTMKAKLEDDLIHRMLNDENGHPHLVDAYIHEVEARLSQSESRIILAVIAAIKAAK